VCCGTYVIVARVAWNSGDRFGARAQDVIELPDLIAGAQGRARQAPERREQQRPARTALNTRSLAERNFASIRLGHAFEFVSLILAGAGLAALLGGSAHDALARPAAEASRALAPGES
jgi:hypothetical protein